MEDSNTATENTMTTEREAFDTTIKTFKVYFRGGVAHVGAANKADAEKAVAVATGCDVMDCNAFRVD